MTIRKLDDDKNKLWLCDVYPQGRSGKRVRKRFATKGEALAYEKFVLKEVDGKPWFGEKAERHHLLDMVDIWHEHHGQSLTHEKYTYRRLKVIALGLGNPIYTLLTAKMFTEYRSCRIAGAIPDLNHRYTSVSFHTCNIEQDLLHETEMEFLTMDEIYKEGSGPLFNIGYSTVYRFISKRIPRLSQQAAHVLRHTFASYYMMNGGNIIALQRILGHSDIKQTMRYAHLAPDHLEDVVTKNPLSGLKK